MKKYILKKNGRKLLYIFLILVIVVSMASCKKEEEIKKADINSIIEKEENNKEEEKEVEKDEKNKISKLDEDREIIYEANYLDELEAYRAIEFVYDEKGEVVENLVEVNFNHCKIPYINLDLSGAKKFNQEMLEYTKEYILNDYEWGKEEELFCEPTSYYEYELTDNFLSIRFQYDMGIFDVNSLVKTYILDLETGEELELAKAINISGINKDFLGVVEGKIVEYYDDSLRFYEEFYENQSFFDYQGETLHNFWEDYYGGNFDFYLTGENELSLFLYFQLPMGEGVSQIELEIKPEDLPLEEEINPVYEYLAKEDYNSYEGAVAFLGYNSYDTLETIASKVETIIYDVGEEGKLSLSYFYKDLDDGSYIVDGDEFYLLSGKYKNGVTKIYPLVYDENSEVGFNQDPAFIYGPNCISFCNFSDIRPNTMVEFIYRDKVIEFIPSLSLMDSDYINEIDGIIDVGDAYRDLEERELFLELTSSTPYMWAMFKMADFVE